MQNPLNLRVTTIAEDLAVAVYQHTAAFPDTERYGLIVQMRRAAISIGSNICEGCGRETNRGLVPFLFIAMGSASELQYQLRIATRLGFGNTESATALAAEIVRLKRMLAALVTRSGHLPFHPIRLHVRRRPTTPEPRARVNISPRRVTPKKGASATTVG